MGRFRLHASLLLAGLAACSEAAPAPTAVSLTPRLPSADVAFLPTEQQPLVDLSVGGFVIHPRGVGQILAQTFMPATNGRLGYVELPVACSAGVLLNVRIRDGLGGPVLYEVNVAGLSDGLDGSFKLIQVYDPALPGADGIKIHKRRSYAIELAALPGPDATDDQCAIAHGPAGDSYAGGQAFYQDPINAPAFLPLPNGEPGDQTDLPFRTLVR